ncbi:MAG: tRNA (N(6)-L-threonylcarbamoyladenosine(37)-C(2))-methylthiotransferase MtaB [Hyphomicrobium sp.]
MSDPLLITLGCRLNAYESEIVRNHAVNAGLDDCIIVNTCAVTGEAVRQARQTIRKLRRERPTARIIVTGCAAQTEPETFAAMDEVDHVVGNTEKLERETFASLARGNFDRVVVNDIMSVRDTALHMVDAFPSRARAWLAIQNGCDHRCTFCIIPYGRGPSRSVPAGAVVTQIRRLVEEGYNEVVLTGVDMTSYGADLPGNMSLGLLTKKILKHVPELGRLRLSSIDQVEADWHLLDAIADETRLMPHLHLSLQAGDDLTLRRMKRRHLRADAIRFCAEARRLRPDIVFGADLIAGFPTETDEMFENTMRLIDECGLTYLHVFPFSPRKGTPAARMPQVAPSKIKERATRLRARGEATHRALLDRIKGTRMQILVEGRDVGRTPHFAEVQIPQGTPVGSLKWAMLGEHNGRRLDGTLEA